ncbi:lysophospholipid acyltransferase family protein [Pontivivens insulae]|uniref:1-acyl-sn-glycerol-3-phosphate acyltransferase n=1 Tax=Pontivivens insulae TaxID=1639689 RepID=A0A2R8ACH0_9RHOB|nr:lysophospholipid acyltransferase family protein [Pontivivens insulae]RED13853.1 1-acyl-sn-glycerol-3-phosphate acyltransferase [Pontivivens insulae]SPF29927.1 1-acyl-sn-glycerol-3-phosphate acyltransferase [Pontivivens insulae]
MLLLRSLIFSLAMYVVMAVLGILWAIPALIRRDWAYWIMAKYCHIVFWLLRVIVGIKVEIRGDVPQGECIVAAKHQSFLDIIMLMGTLPRPKFIMKKSVKWTPIVGFYAMQIGCAPVDRGKHGATAEMVEDVAEEQQDPGQIVIYPQGTRVAPGLPARYKRGTAILYQTFNLPCVPAATNAGLFWGRNSLLRKPGTAVIEFLPTIPVGLQDAEFMQRLEMEVEMASNKLLPD